jgi:predicted nucleic acid-binding protein
MDALLLDTSYLLAVQLEDDQQHAVAQAHWRRLISDVPPLVTTSMIFGEVATYLSSRHLHATAVEVGEDLLSNPDIELVWVNEALLREGWSFFRRHSDKTYSLTDCVSFVLMKQRRITTALAFDKHFAQAGFMMLP